MPTIEEQKEEIFRQLLEQSNKLGGQSERLRNYEQLEDSHTIRGEIERIRETVSELFFKLNRLNLQLDFNEKKEEKKL